MEATRISSPKIQKLILEENFVRKKSKIKLFIKNKTASYFFFFFQFKRDFGGWDRSIFKEF